MYSDKYTAIDNYCTLIFYYHLIAIKNRFAFDIFHMLIKAVNEFARLSIQISCLNMFNYSVDIKIPNVGLKQMHLFYKSSSDFHKLGFTF